MKKNSPMIMGFLLLITLSTARANDATVVSDSELYQRPSIQSSKIMSVKAGTPVTVESRLGGWKKISVGKKHTGWIRSYKVRTGTLQVSQKEQKSGGFFAGLASLSRKASGLFSSNKKDYSFQRTATIGVRGLSEEQIKNAKPDLLQLQKMETFRSNKSASRSYARLGKLVAAKIPHMPRSKAEQ